METILAFVVGGLVAVGLYLLLQRNLIRMLFGVVILTNSVNLLIFTLGRLTRGATPLLEEGGEQATSTFANALPQALILTSIVISFGLVAFLLALIYRSDKTFRTLDSNQMRAADALEEENPPENKDDSPNNEEGSPMGEEVYEREEGA